MRPWSNVSHPLHAQFRARYERIVLNMTTEFQALQELGLLLPGVKPDEAARTLIAAQDGAQIQWLYDPEGVDINDIIQGLLDTLLMSPPTATGAAS
ncbi:MULTISPECIES: TetR family transcriptional regulator C-terminal domain-containing protein [unclassified Frondihabitans]|uniref:TetR family transcriptional regulator C-terminal domain-containing protein n=1 Tax=unclassified Frondihabitans TaxID=2626248 RepID=UPI000F4E9BA9|nr:MULTISPECIES: TetR family transcriptional regulator C-terminal domain-containing protein [unclassified Frondihabitans]